jgi:hypothetical protein
MTIRSPVGVRAGLVAVSAVALVFAVSPAGATPKDTSREECLDAHGRGQDLRDRGQLVRARQTFTSCAQTSCPALVQSDCARFADEIGRLVPTVSFAARDANAADLPGTSVFIDDELVTTRLDDGKSHEVDPGKHIVRFVHEGRETTLRVVVNQGEKGRLLVGTFTTPIRAGSPFPVATTATTRGITVEPPVASPEPSRSLLPLVVAGAGVAAAVTGTILYSVGMGKVPDNCSTSSMDCAAPPGDSAFDRAHSGVALANAGAVTAIGGAIVFVGGLAMYFLQPKRAASTSVATTPRSLFVF